MSKRTGAPGGVERRKARRRPIIDSFSLFVTIPRKGVHRLKIHDVSELGMGFEIDTEGEIPEDFPVAPGENLDVQLYLNQSLYLDLHLTVIRVPHDAEVRRIGAEFAERASPSYKAYRAFLGLLDQLADAGRLTSSDG